MTSLSNKRKLEIASDDSQLDLKRHKNDESEEERDMVTVRFQNETREYNRHELIVIDFCKAKLQRWSPNIDTEDDDDDDDLIEDKVKTNSSQQQYLIDLSGFPFITPTLFTAIIHLQQILSGSVSDYHKAAKSLLTDNITMNHLPQLFECCKPLLITQIFNEKIFKHYFDEHPPIAYQTYKQLQKEHKNEAFITSIISTQLSLCNIMSKYSVQKKGYDLCNEMKKRDCFQYSGNSTPNAQNAMQYAIEQINYERSRETRREEALPPLPRVCAYDDYGNAVDAYGHVVDEYEYDMYDDYEYEEQRLHGYKIYDSEDIDYGLCTAFDDMIKYGTNIEPFLKELFDFIDRSLLFERGNDGRKDRSHFCFYGLAYIVHRIWILYLEKNDLIVKYVGSAKTIGYVFDSFEVVLKRWGKNNDEMKMTMIQQRINDCIKWKDACYSNETNKNFPESVVASLCAIDIGPQWLINNFALKCNNGDCRKVLQSILENCTKEICTKNNESMNKTFEKYLGVTIKTINK